jgi:acyl-CoA reductase-like NAD-dependent aldehyde dehydrogenase
MSTATRTTEDSTLANPRTYQLFIDGRFVDAADGRTFESLDPGTGQPLAHVAEASAADIDLAVSAARRALTGPWATMSPSDRGRIIHKIGDLLAEHAEELATLESLDSGKPRTAAMAVEVPLAIDMFH